MRTFECVRMSACGCVHVCVLNFECVSLCKCVHVSAYFSLWKWVCARECVFVWVSQCVRVSGYFSLCKWMCACECVLQFVWVCACECVRTSACASGCVWYTCSKVMGWWRGGSPAATACPPDTCASWNKRRHIVYYKSDNCKAKITSIRFKPTNATLESNINMLSKVLLINIVDRVWNANAKDYLLSNVDIKLKIFLYLNLI